MVRRFQNVSVPADQDESEIEHLDDSACGESFPKGRAYAIAFLEGVVFIRHVVQRGALFCTLCVDSRQCLIARSDVITGVGASCRGCEGLHRQRRLNRAFKKRRVQGKSSGDLTLVKPLATL